MKRGKLRWLTARPIAHRGLHDVARGRPENSLAAFDAATASRYAIECDVHLSADGIPIVFHDDNLTRLTAHPGSVRDRTAAELGNLRIAGTREWIPTLDEVLDLVEGRVPLVLELKHMPGRDAGLAWTVIERLKRYDGAAALMSFDHALIADARAAGPHLPRGLVASGNWRAGSEHFKAALRLGADFISYCIDDLPTPMPILARRLLGVPLICWTVRNPEQLSKAKRWTDQITFEGFSP
jgi:glycerophosphoryl diester phosphodiesterase